MIGTNSNSELAPEAPKSSLSLGAVPEDVVQKWLDKVNAILIDTGHGRVLAELHDIDGRYIGDIETEIKARQHGFTIFFRAQHSEMVEVTVP